MAKKEENKVIEAAIEYHKKIVEEKGEAHPKAIDAAKYIEQLKDIK